MIDIKFKKGEWEEFFNYAYNERFPFKPQFIQEDDCIGNGRNPDMPDGFDYTTIMTKEKYPVGTKIWLTCSFESYGAPLITLTDTLEKDKDGDLIYGIGQEFVLWEEGFNAFDFYKVDGVIKWHQLIGQSFPVKPFEKHEFCVEIMEKYICFTTEGQSTKLRVDNLPSEVYIGITGCENVNKLYSVKIEK